MPHALLEIAEWKALEKNKEAEGIALRKGFAAQEVKAVGDNVLRFIITTGSVDRDRDTINPLGWTLENFKNNPVVLFGHNHSMPPIAKANDLFLEDMKLIADTEFVTEDIQEFGAMIHKLYLGGFMRAVSVGFLPDERIWSEEQGGIKFISQDLLEFSAVPVPANPEALLIARSAGIDIAPLKGWATQVLDEWTGGKQSIGASRKQLERIVRLSDKSDKTFHVSPAKQDTLRERNIWEPNLKAFLKDLSWPERLGSMPGEADCEVPSYIMDEYQEQFDELKEFLEIDNDVNDISGDSNDSNDIPDETGEIDNDPNDIDDDSNDSNDTDEDTVDVDLDEDDVELALIGLEKLQGIVITGLGDDEMLLSHIKATLVAMGIPEDKLLTMAELEADATVDTNNEDVAKMVTDLETEFKAFQKTISDLESENADLKSENGELVLQVAQSLVKEAGLVDPEDLIKRITGALAKRVRAITGSVD